MSACSDEIGSRVALQASLSSPYGPSARIAPKPSTSTSILGLRDPGFSSDGRGYLRTVPAGRRQRAGTQEITLSRSHGRDDRSELLVEGRPARERRGVDGENGQLELSAFRGHERTTLSHARHSPVDYTPLPECVSLGKPTRMQFELGVLRNSDLSPYDSSPTRTQAKGPSCP